MPASDPVTAVASAVAEFINGIASPLLKNYNAHKYDDQYNKAIKELDEVLANPTPSSVQSIFLKLCLNASQPIGNLGGKTVELPLECARSLGLIAADDQRKSSQCADFIQGLSSK